MCNKQDTCHDLDCFLQMMYLTNYCCFVCSLSNWSSNSSTPITACNTMRSLSRCLTWYSFSSLQWTRTSKILPSRLLTKNLLEPRDDVILAGPIQGHDTVFLVVVKAPLWGQWIITKSPVCKSAAILVLSACLYF